MEITDHNAQVMVDSIPSAGCADRSCALIAHNEGGGCDFAGERARKTPIYKNGLVGAVNGVGKCEALSQGWCARHERDEEVQVLWGSRSQRPQANRKATGREAALKEVESEPVRRRTETGYEASRMGASRPALAKLQRPNRRDVNPATVQGTSRVLPGEILPNIRKGDVAKAMEQEVSRGHSSSIEAGQGRHPERGRKLQRTKGQTDGRANRL